jgi:hypothetical protein
MCFSGGQGLSIELLDHVALFSLASASQVLGLQAWTTMPGSCGFLIDVLYQVKFPSDPLCFLVMQNTAKHLFCIIESWDFFL